MENLAKNLVELSYEYERTKDEKTRKQIITILKNIQKMVKEEIGKS